MRNVFQLGFIIAFVSFGGLGFSQQSTASKVRKAVDAGNKLYCTAYEKSDSLAFAAVYDENGARLEKTGEVVRGRAAISREMEEHWKQLLVPHRVTAETESLWVVDDLAYELGRFTFRLTPPKEDERTFTGHYLTIWKKQGDGGWKIFRDVNVTGQ